MISDYDKVPYKGAIIPNSYPGHLALCSLWHNGRDSPLQGFHLTELGCGDGANLLPMAFYHPDSTFMGIDIAESGLSRAREGAAQIGLHNIQFMQKDICKIEQAEIVQCDYIIAHGLYSWVSDDIREAILQFCRNSLSATGLAFISYNAQPGWASRGLVRDILLRSASVQQAAIEDKASKAIEVASELLQAMPSRDYAYAVLIAEELERVRDGKPFYVYHEYLEEFNQGFWLRDFIERARQNNLNYVCDAQFSQWEGQVPKELRHSLSQAGLDPIEQEETADLLCNRYFHASILCPGDGMGDVPGDAPGESVSHPKILEQVSIASSLGADSDPFDLTEGVVELFIGSHGQEITLDVSIIKAAVVLLAAQWPIGMQLNNIFQQASRLLSEHGHNVLENAQSQLTEELITLFEAGVIDLRLQQANYSRGLPEYPKLPALARYEIEHRDAFTTPYHLPISLNDQFLEVVSDMDGSKSITEIKRLFGEDIVDQSLDLLVRWGLLEE
jgi:ubiquinone/menaquinone biosynthesis C-methylase UbiE/methyltransferase-like protein